MTDEERVGLRDVVEDWAGSDLKNAGGFEVLRAANGVVVRPAGSFERSTVARTSQMLVFQNPAHFFDWIQIWLKNTKDDGV